MLGGAATSHEERAVWLPHARWLVAGLTFQLGADLVRTAIAPTWDDVGRPAAIALIRTFLNYFLERDVTEVAARQRRDRAIAERSPRRPRMTRARPGRRSESRGGRSTCRPVAACAPPADSGGSSSARTGTSRPSSPCAES